jgi:hypothetical protein
MLGLLAASGSESTAFVDDVFSAYTRTGTGASATITTGIDLITKGGLVWTKGRSGATDHKLTDTARGVTKGIISNTTAAQTTDTNGITAFSTTSHTVGSDSNYNTNAATYVDWVFRKSPKFFDIVIWTGDGTSNRAIAHSLGATVGMVITKITSTTGDWNTYHRSATGDLVLNTTAAQTGSRAIITAADSSTFTVTGVANTNGATYVAYLFAHDTSTDGIVQCGSFNPSGVTDVTLGWEPQYLMIKRADSLGNWDLMDIMRGMPEITVQGVRLFANSSTAEVASSSICPTATGFKVNGLSGTDIYLAIRRPNKPPTTGTQVYNAIARTGTGAAATVTGVGFAPDLVTSLGRNSTPDNAFFDRLRGGSQFLLPNDTIAERSEATQITAFGVDGISIGTGVGYGVLNYNTFTYINHFFKRAIGVFDEVCYTGTGVAKTVAHGLGAVPELMIVKARSGATQWDVYCNQIANTEKLVLNSTAAKSTDATAWNSTTPTASVFTIGTNANVNTNTATYVTYLFATKSGISKVGIYTGNGSSQTINAGFTTGARFVLIKRTDSTGDWYVWDTVRGIVAGNDPHLSLNTTAVEVTTDDSIDPDNSGFIVNQLAATNINVTSATYIYLSLA